MDFKKVADVLEKTALLLDASISAKTAAVQQEREKVVEELCNKFAEATGDEVSEELRKKLSSADQGVFQLLEKLSVTNTTPAELGAPSDRRGQQAPQTIKEASELADERFVNWVTS